MERGHVEGTESHTIRRVGTRIAGKWCLVRLLGVGGMAAVYEARHATGRRVAIKMMHAHHKGNTRLHKRFVREAYVANSLTHPAVVPVYDVDLHDDGTPYLIMDLLIGQSVEAVRGTQGGKLAPERVREIAEVVLEVLVEAHSKGIVHRDLKPANLFITKQGELKVLDFGIAKCPQFSSAFPATTRYGSLLGTPAFMSPEQARGQWDAVDHQSDLWSLGATLFTLLTGRAVHEVANVNEQWALAMGTPATTVRDLEPDLPESLATAVDGALRFSKSERWPNAAHMYRVLTGREAPPLSTAEEPAHDDFSTLSRTLTLKGTLPSRSGKAGRHRHVLALSSAVLVVLATATASQRSASSQPTVQRSDPGVQPVVAAPIGPTPAWHEPGPKASPAAPVHASVPPRERGARDELPAAQAKHRLPSKPKRREVDRDPPTTGKQLEFGALLDVWE